jgi:hypothetical protein
MKSFNSVEMGNKPKKDVAARFDILPNTLSTILKNKEKIVKFVVTVNQYILIIDHPDSKILCCIRKFVKSKFAITTQIIMCF